jgi:hypothetical protein
MESPTPSLRSSYFVFENGVFQRLFASSEGYLLEDGTEIPLQEGGSPMSNVCNRKAFSLTKSSIYHLSTFRPKITTALLESISGIKAEKWQYINESEMETIQQLVSTIIPQIDELFRSYQFRLYNESEQFARLVTSRIR